MSLKEAKIMYGNKKRRSFSFNTLRKFKNKDEEYKPKNINFIFYNDFELNSLNYKDALEIDKRTCNQYYLSLLRVKHPIIFTFYPTKDYNIFIIKINLFLFSFVIYYALNTFFFNYTIIHKIYENGGDYNLSPQIIYSFIISYYINNIIKYLTLSEKNLLELKQEKTIKSAKDKVSKVERCLIIKNIIYFVFSFVFFLFFWYYLSSFCAVYQNSQKHLIINTFISFLLGLIIPFVINLVPVVLRRYSLNLNNRECIYKFSKILQIL